MSKDFAGKQNDKEQQNQAMEQSSSSFTATVVLIGFFGGVIWSIVLFVAYYLNFTEVGPALILNPWALSAWKNKVIGQLIGIPVIGVLSIGVAFIYRALFVKFKSILLSLLFGAAIWGIVFYLLNPIFPDLKPLRDLSWNSIVTTLCIYLLYGLFVGYSISYHYEEDKIQAAYSNN